MLAAHWDILDHGDFMDEKNMVKNPSRTPTSKSLRRRPDPRTLPGGSSVGYIPSYFSGMIHQVPSGNLT